MKWQMEVPEKSQYCLAPQDQNLLSPVLSSAVWSCCPMSRTLRPAEIRFQFQNWVIWHQGQQLPIKNVRIFRLGCYRWWHLPEDRQKDCQGKWGVLQAQDLQTQVLMWGVPVACTRILAWEIQTNNFIHLSMAGKVGETESLSPVTLSLPPLGVTARRRWTKMLVLSIWYWPLSEFSLLSSLASTLLLAFIETHFRFKLCLE